jgi:hypothetical protein
MNFFNILLAPTMKTWYTFHKFRNRLGRWIKEPERGGQPRSFQADCRAYNHEIDFSTARRDRPRAGGHGS